MSASTKEKLFAVPYVANVSLELLENNFVLPDYDDFVSEIPDILRITGGLANLDTSFLKELREEGFVYYELGRKINEQNDKINMILGYILSTSEDISIRHYSKYISGNEVVVETDRNDLEIGRYLRIRLYLLEFYLSIYCYGKISKIEETEEGKSLVYVDLVLIREEDMDNLVSATFKIQSKQLKNRNQKKTIRTL